ncbi:hypothetical protein D3C71_344400 [compost metagenome]
MQYLILTIVGLIAIAFWFTASQENKRLKKEIEAINKNCKGLPGITNNIPEIIKLIENINNN